MKQHGGLKWARNGKMRRVGDTRILKYLATTLPIVMIELRGEGIRRRWFLVEEKYFTRAEEAIARATAGK